MDGVWKEDGSFEVSKGKGTSKIKGIEKGKRKGKGKGKKGKGKGREEDEEPPEKRQRVGEEDDEVESEEAWYEREWKDMEVCLINLKAAALNGVVGVVKKNMGLETVIVDGKEKKIRRFLVDLEGGKGEKSIKMENLFKVITGAVVKLRGLDTVELNDSIGECGRLDAASMRYDVTLSDGRHIKAKPSNVEFVARYEKTKIGGDKEQMEWVRNANGMMDLLGVIEWFQYPTPNLIPASAFVEYIKKFPKAVVIGNSKAGNPKGLQMLVREVTSSLLAPANSRVIYLSMPRDKQCVAPTMTELRHDELLRIGTLAEWVLKRCAPRPVYFLLPSAAAKGTTTVLASSTCAWPLYMSLCTEVVVVDSERWHKSPWARMDALLGAVWARKPLYLLPEKYQPAVELGDKAPPTSAEDDEDAQENARKVPLSFRAEEPFTISRPVDCQGAGQPPLLVGLANRALEAESDATAKVQRPCLGIKRLG
eukprot:TRINITY_DN13724_c0_g1_i1.p1 TRINITY_DN13724_c0_g1~~TRINITY_DN13724_c0_g1_i1.p1  ORF type:complete len:479 (-),score=122.28 TRINITY_DN13724_c0_g1_i1:126-1562(-)